MRKTIRYVVPALLLAWSASAMARTPSAAWLMQQMADQAQHNAVLAEGAQHSADAATWRAWAGRYRMLAALPAAQQVDAETVARSNIEGNRRLARQARQAGMADAAELYQASVAVWEDLARQVRTGGTLVVHFPQKPMLHPVPGLPGTPWENAGESASRHATDCRMLAQRVRSCEAQMSGLLDRSLTTGEDHGDFMAVRRQQCNRAQELYLAQCGSH